MAKRFPKTKTERCVFCGAETHLTRHGDGKLWRGRPSYWYTSDHACPKLEKVSELNRELNSFLKGKL